ncbi:MAG: hypothetical protein Q4G45_08940 [Actinomycetia bacterium]|nr:hypothetical protein [Actinomycetes bacterium]
MSRLVEVLAGLVEDGALTSWLVWVLRAVTVTAGLGAMLLCQLWSGLAPAGWVVGGLLLAGAVVWPQSLLGAGFLLLPTGWWLLGEGPLGQSVAVAVLLAVVHQGLAELAWLPRQVRLSRKARARLWGSLAAYAVATAALAWLVVAVVRLRTGASAAEVVIALVTAASATVVGVMAHRRHTSEPTT